MKEAQIEINKAFGIKKAIADGKKLTIKGFEDEGNPYVPAKINNYIFDGLSDVLAFLQRPRGDALWICGDTGCGKTTLVEQVANRLNWPAQTVTANEGLTFSELVGQFVLCSEKEGEAPQMKWVNGPLTTSMEEGHLFILNEGDLLDPAESSGLNEILAGKPLSIPQLGGKLINPSKSFRCIVTGNSNGGGDQTGLYAGVLQQNIAAMDRYRLMEKTYLSPKDEKKLLSKQFPAIETNIVEGMVKVANAARRAFRGDDPKTKLSVTLSTRTIMRWAGLMVDAKNQPNAAKYALERALLFRATATDREAINQFASSVFGEETWRG